MLEKINFQRLSAIRSFFRLRTFFRIFIRLRNIFFGFVRTFRLELFGSCITAGAVHFYCKQEGNSRKRIFGMYNEVAQITCRMV